MSFPHTAGFQTHSDTSRQAAELLTTRETDQQKIIMVLGRVGAHGQNAGEVAKKLSKPTAIISARLREMELEGHVIKTAQKRDTDMARDGFVYVTPSAFNERMGRAPVKGDEGKASMKAMLEKIYKESRRRDVNINDRTMVECVWYMTPEEMTNFKTLIGRK